MGRLIPAGTGLKRYRDLIVSSKNDNIIDANDVRRNGPEAAPSKVSKTLFG